jgi:hypothetical protein
MSRREFQREEKFPHAQREKVPVQSKKIPLHSARLRVPKICRAQYDPKLQFDSAMHQRQGRGVCRAFHNFKSEHCSRRSSRGNSWLTEQYATRWHCVR